MPPTGSHQIDDIPWVNTLLIAMSIGLAGIVVYAWAQQSWKAFACALLVALAAGLAGAFLGFLFGIPKSVATSTATTESGTTRATSEYQGNSNLEQISDWLTKILVGAGLVQLGTIRNEFNELGWRLSRSECLGKSGWVVGPALVIAYSVAGFLLAYLWARIYMAKDLSSAGGGAAANADAGGAQASVASGTSGASTGTATAAVGTETAAAPTEP
jgi:hypothetical protein